MLSTEKKFINQVCARLEIVPRLPLKQQDQAHLGVRLGLKIARWHTKYG